jgi:hypothetical protein
MKTLQPDHHQELSYPSPDTQRLIDQLLSMRNDTLQKESGYKKKEVSGPSKSHGSLQADNCTMARACKELGKRKKN